MLWAIDIGNTQTVVGLHDGLAWRSTWRVDTDRHRTEDELAVTLKGLCELEGLPFAAEKCVYASVVPGLNGVWEAFAHERLGVKARRLEKGADCGIPVSYDPPHGVGADRIANALAALALFEPPIVVVDFGTATTFDVVDAQGTYVGGAILPGVVVSLEALTSRTAKLPGIELRVPPVAIGRNTVQAIESGVMWGYAGSVNELAARISAELGSKPKVVATGGLGKVFVELCPLVEEYLPSLTLDGLRLFAEMP